MRRSDALVLSAEPLELRDDVENRKAHTGPELIELDDVVGEEDSHRAVVWVRLPKATEAAGPPDGTMSAATHGGYCPLWLHHRRHAQGLCLPLPYEGRVPGRCSCVVVLGKVCHGLTRRLS